MLLCVSRVPALKREAAVLLPGVANSAEEAAVVGWGYDA